MRPANSRMDGVKNHQWWTRWFPQSPCQTPVAAQLGERSLSDPASGQDLQALDRIGRFDDLDGPLSDPPQGIPEIP